VLRLGGPKAFWLFHKRAFENQQALTVENLEAWAVEAGIGLSTFRAAIESEQFAAKIDKDIAAGKAASVTGTPASFLNGVFLSGAQPLERFQAIIEEQEKAALELQRKGVPPELIYAKLSEENKAKAPPALRPASPPDTTTVWKVPVEKSPVRGPKTALVTLVMFGDFQCPFCKKAAITVEGLMAKYGDKLRFVYKHKPLPFHARAEPAAELAIEARAQKGDLGFWKAYKLLTESSSDLSDAELLSHATSLRLNVVKVKQAIASKQHSAVIGLDQDLAGDLQVTGTPHFFINGRRLIGAQPAEKFEAIIDEEIKRAEKLLAAGAPPAGIYEALQKDAKLPPPPPSAQAAPSGTQALFGAKHLLIMYAGSRRAPATVTRTRDEALKLAEQVFQMAASGAAFESLVAQYSDEPGAAARGGDLGRFPKGAMVPEFEKAVESLKVGSIGVAESPFGFHVILRTQ
jgi:protein-disulfide isomerase